MSLSGDILSNIDMDASIEAIGEIAGSIDLDGSGSTPTITASATVSPDPGIPYCDVVKTGTDEYPNFTFNFSGLKGEQGEQGVQGVPGQDGTDGTDGVTPDISATASITNTSGVPSVTVTKTGTDEAPNFAFAFENLKGEQGIQGEQGVQGVPGQDGTYPDITATASVDQTTGIPSVVVTRSGTEDEPNFDFAFSNLKGEQGDQGVPGRDGTDGVNGADGVTPLISASGSVDNNVGIPNVVITRSGTEAAPNFDFAFHNLKGDPGTNGVPTGGTAGQVLTKSSSVDYDCNWDSLVIPSTAAEISFDNTGTGMTATDVQDAVTELKSNLTDKIRVITTTVTSKNAEIPFTVPSGYTKDNCVAVILGFQTAGATTIYSGVGVGGSGSTYQLRFKLLTPLEITISVSVDGLVNSTCYVALIKI